MGGKHQTMKTERAKSLSGPASGPDAHPPPTDSFAGLGSHSARVCDALRADIRSGVFTPGSKLPTQQELCGRFGVTRPTVGKALRHLSRNGMVQVRQGAGTFVIAPPATSVPTASRTVSVMFHYDADSLRAVQGMVMDAGFLLCTYSQRDWGWDPQRERAFLEAVKAERRRALIAFCSPREPRNADLLEELDAQGTRVVHIEPFSDDPPAQSHIMPDYETAGADAATDFLVGGCRSFVYLPMGDAPFERLLERGFARTLSMQGAGFDPARDRFQLGAFEQVDQAPARALAAFLRTKPRPVGLFCRAVHNAQAVRKLFPELGWTEKRDVRLLAIHQTGGRPDVGVDQLVFDHLDCVRRAVAAVANPAWRGVRELVKPTLVRKTAGTA